MLGVAWACEYYPAWRAQGLSPSHATAAPNRPAPGGRRPEPAAGESGVEGGSPDNYLPWEPATGQGGADQPPSFWGYLKCHLLSHVADGIRPVNLIEPRIFLLKPSKTAKV